MTQSRYTAFEGTGGTLGKTQLMVLVILRVLTAIGYCDLLLSVAVKLCSLLFSAP